VTAVDSLLTDALRDRYLVERELGQGGMATVYLAEDLRHHRRVAVKVLRPELAAALGVERFLHEIRDRCPVSAPAHSQKGMVRELRSSPQRCPRQLSRSRTS
jgi:serine/threonine protein kinase